MRVFSLNFYTVICCSVVMIFATYTQNVEAQNYSSLVYPGIDGKLVYVPDEKGNIIPDFSHSGYKGSGVSIPYVPIKEILWPVEGDDSPNIQAAIDRVSALPLDENGFRGAVLLKMGYYELSSPLHISASGVVLRGEGQGETGTILIGLGQFDGGYGNRQKANLIVITGKTCWDEEKGSSRNIIDDYVPVGVYSFRVENTKGFRVGDTVLVRRHGNQDWIHEIGMDLENKNWRWEPFTINYDRIIKKIEGNRITVDAPITCAIEKQWGGGEIVKYMDTGRISQVGIENLRSISEFDVTVRTNEYSNIDRHPYYGEEYYSDENHYWNFIVIDNARNVWIRNVTALHFAGSMVSIRKGSKWVTVQDCVSLEPVSIRGGGRRFTYQIMGQLCLVQRCTSDKGRHSFVLGDYTACGPNVFLDCKATIPYSSSEPHYHYVTGALYDNVVAPLTARFWKDISIGWAGANCVFWNCEGSYLIQKPPTAQNYSTGHIGIHAMVFNTRYMDLTKENGYIESWDRHVTPQSLYLKQLEDRLGKDALLNIGHQ